MAIDIVNASFEFFGAGFQAINVYQILKDKAVKGVHWLSVLFFSLWGWWNIYYYPQLDQFYSMLGAIALVLVNTIWLGLMWKYK